MKVATQTLLTSLTEAAKTNQAEVRRFKTLSLEQLNYKATPETWSILECIEHLNLYAHFYVVEIKERIDQTPHKTPNPIFKGSILGNYFEKSMLPKENLKKIKTFEDKNPNGSQLGIDVLDKFIAFQDKWFSLLEAAAKVNISKTKTSITIKMLKLRMGDTLRFVFAHDKRHIVQAMKIAGDFKAEVA